jgi:hypothetical protein
MAFIKFSKDEIIIDESDINSKPIVEGFITLIEKRGFDHGSLACGMMPSPDFGYFELADRFWRASLCIYSFGATNCFWERGVGYAEPWLFTARHAVELYLKGFLLTTIWLKELQNTSHLSSEKKEICDLRKEISKPHNLLNIYNDYISRITSVINNWNTNEIPEIPDISLLVLKPVEIDMLKELDETDETSFRFRYPSLNNKKNNIDSLQQIDWKHDKSMLMSKTGLPKKAGYFFNHIEVMNNLHELIIGINNIVEYSQGIFTYQDVMNDNWGDIISELTANGG